MTPTAAIDVTFRIQYYTTMGGGGSISNYSYFDILAGDSTTIPNPVTFRLRDIQDGSPGCGCPCESDTTLSPPEVVTSNPAYNIVIV
jgi:hypothetical protein